MALHGKIKRISHEQKISKYVTLLEDTVMDRILESRQHGSTRTKGRTALVVIGRAESPSVCTSPSPVVSCHDSCQLHLDFAGEVSKCNSPRLRPRTARLVPVTYRIVPPLLYFFFSETARVRWTFSLSCPIIFLLVRNFPGLSRLLARADYRRYALGL